VAVADDDEVLLGKKSKVAHEAADAQHTVGLGLRGYVPPPIGDTKRIIINSSNNNNNNNNNNDDDDDDESGSGAQLDNMKIARGLEKETI
jgi:hypothetical protein